MKSAIVVIMVICVVGSASMGGTYGGGTGYWDNPYIISTPEHLNQIAANTSDLNSYFILIADIDMSAYTGTSYNVIGTTSQPFTGTFDGNGHTISNLTYNTSSATSYVGLFGYGSYCTIKNLTLEDVNLSSTGHGIGAILGGAMWPIIQNCQVTGTITGGNSSTNIGGLIGYANNGSISLCSCNVTILAGDSSSRIGGLIGSGSPSINDCHTAGSVKGGISCRSVGGLIGNYSDSTFAPSIENCSSICDVEAGSIEVGGLVGYQALPVIRNCFSAGNIKGAGSVGGLVGFSRISTLSTDAVTDSYSTANVTMSSTGSYAGGLIGYSEGGQVSRCRAEGNLGGGRDGMGGLIGVQIGGTVTDCIATGDISSIAAANNIGGFAGALWVTLVNNCGSTGNVSSQGGSGTRSIGGFAGVVDSGGITNSYSLSNTNGGPYSNNVGGLVGYQGNNASSITKCFSAGSVYGEGAYIGGLVGYKSSTSTVTTCFWDIEASGQTTSAGGKGKTTADMQNSNTFTSAGWDFTGETANGTDDIWEMRGYPALSFEPSIGIEGDFTASVPEGGQTTITLSIYNLTSVPFNWTIDGYESAEWITNITPVSGSSSGPLDVAIVTMTLDGAGLDLADYFCSLVVTADNGDTANVPFVLTVYNSVALDDLAQMGEYWKTGLCDFGDECKPFDWYVDGGIDEKDLMQIAQAWLGEGIERYAPTVEDGFETGDMSALNWSSSGQLPWTITTDKYEGFYSIRSGAITDSNYSAIELTTDTTGWQIDTVGFAYKISSESGYDYMRFYIDDVEKFNTSGDTSWLTANYAITPGLHTLKWVYSKDSDASSGQDSPVDRLYKNICQMIGSLR